jgi:hypothetical protein
MAFSSERLPRDVVQGSYRFAPEFESEQQASAGF